MDLEKRRLIAGNWKMNRLRADGIALIDAVLERVASAGPPACELLLCPPATLLAEVGRTLAGSAVELGGQDCHPSESGAHTGDISAAMLVDAGCRYVIVGHSERRADHHESDAVVAAKASSAHDAGLTALVCVGETEAQRDAGQALTVIKSQVEGSLPAGATPENTVVAYEPIWAIGTGRTPSPGEVREMHAHIRRNLSDLLGTTAAMNLRVLYGGSVNPRNAAALLAIEDVDGALIGGASLVAEDFCKIAQSCP